MIESCPGLAGQWFTGDWLREEITMLPGLSDADCRVAELRYRELHAEAERQRRAAHTAPIPAIRVRVMKTIQRNVGALLEQANHLLKSVWTQRPTEHSAAPVTLAVSK
jgi:hypothetical protein